MSDITPMAAVPSEVNYGRIRANFVAFIADDNGNVLEEVPLEGNVILTPTVGVLRFPSTSPPRTAVIQTLQCPVIGGILYPPGTPLGGPFPSQTGVAAVASDQPAGLPTTVQWTASFSLENTSAQPNPVTFEVPSGGVVDLTTVMPATPEPGIVVVVSTESRDRAEAAAAAAAGSAGSAFDDAAIAQGARLGAEAARDAAAGSATAAQAAAAALQDTGWRKIPVSVEGTLINEYRVRRVGSTVFFTLAKNTVNVFTSLNEIGVGGVPAGFQPSASYSSGVPLVAGGAYDGYPSASDAQGVVRRGATGVLVKPGSLTNRPLLTATYVTDDPWPTTLPGTPA